MRLTDFTDFSLRVLIYLALAPDSRVTIDEINSRYRVSRHHLTKVVQRLGQLGYVETVRGRGGGLRLAQGALTTPVGRLVRQFEADFRMVECFAPSGRGCVLENACTLQNKLSEALDAYLKVLDSVTLADLVRAPSPMTIRLFPATLTPTQRPVR